MGTGEILGGVFSPSIAGVLGDIYGLSATLWFLLALTGGAFLCSLFLRESAPAVLEKHGRKPLYLEARALAQ
jgi:hypothetical protein